MRAPRSLSKHVLALGIAMLATSCRSGSRASLPGGSAPPPSPNGGTAAATARPSGGAADSSAGVTQTLYQRLGGEAGLRAVVSQFVKNVASDPRIGHYFADTDFDQLT